MTFKTPSRLRLAGIAAGVVFALCLSFIAFDVALAQTAPAAAPAAAEPTVNKGDTAWMLSATIFVLLRWGRTKSIRPGSFRGPG